MTLLAGHEALLVVNGGVDATIPVKVDPHGEEEE